MKTSKLNITISNEKVNNSTGKKIFIVVGDCASLIQDIVVVGDCASLIQDIHCSWGLGKSDTRYAENQISYLNSIHLHHILKQRNTSRLILLYTLRKRSKENDYV